MRVSYCMWDAELEKKVLVLGRAEHVSGCTEREWRVRREEGLLQVSHVPRLHILGYKRSIKYILARLFVGNLYQCEPYSGLRLLSCKMEWGEPAFVDSMYPHVEVPDSQALSAVGCRVSLSHNGQTTTLTNGSSVGDEDKVAVVLFRQSKLPWI